MKKFICLFLVIVSSLSFISCSKDYIELKEVGNDWRVWGLIDYSATMLIDRRNTDVHLCVSDDGIDVYYDKPIQLIIGSCKFPEKIEGAKEKITRFSVEDINFDDIPDISVYVYLGCVRENLFVWTYTDEDGFVYSEEYSEIFCNSDGNGNVDLKQVKGENGSSWDKDAEFSHNVEFALSDDRVYFSDYTLQISTNIPSYFNLCEIIENSLTFTAEDNNFVILRDVTTDYNPEKIYDLAYLSDYETDYLFDDFQAVYGITDLGEDGIECSAKYPSPAEDEKLIEKSEGRISFDNVTVSFSCGLFKDGNGHYFVKTVFVNGRGVNEIADNISDSVTDTEYSELKSTES